MPRVDFEGTIHDFPDDFTQQDISKALSSLGNQTNPVAPDRQVTEQPLAATTQPVQAPSVWLSPDAPAPNISPPVNKGFMPDLSASMQNLAQIPADAYKRGEHLADLNMRAGQGEPGFMNQAGRAARLGFNVAGTEVGSALDTAGNLGKAAYNSMPDLPVLLEPVKDVENAVADSSLGKGFGEAVNNVGQKYGEFKKNNPNTADTLEAAGNIAMVAPITKPLTAVADTGVTKALMSDAGKILPEELQSLNPLVKANARNAGKINPSEIGMNANKGISEEFNRVNDTVKEAYTNASTHGDFGIPAPGITAKLENLTNHLDNKFGKTGRDRVAFNTLDQIKEKLLNTNPNIQSVAGEKIAVRDISANDLMSIESAINEALPSVGKKLLKGDTVLLNFKSNIQKLLGEASTKSPEFGAAYTNAKKLYGDMADTFYNPQLNTVWKRNDYVKWKNDPENISSQTLSRANKMTDYLDTEDSGKIMAVMKALPEGQRQTVMDAALKMSKKDKISVSNAVIQLMTLHPGSALSTTLRLAQKGAGSTPLERAVKNTKGLMVRPSDVASKAAPVESKLAPPVFEESGKPYVDNTPRHDTRFDSDGNYIKPEKPILALPAPRKDPIAFGKRTESRYGTDKNTRPYSPEAPAKQGMLPGPDSVQMVDRQGNARPMTGSERQSAETSRKKAFDTGLTPDVRRSQIQNQIEKAYKQRDLARNASKEAEIAKIAEKSSVPVEQLVDMADKNISELATILGEKNNDSAFAEALRRAVKNKKPNK